MQRPNLWLFLVILIEGYVVLAAELLAIRLLIPFVGSGVEVIAIIISGVLLPLAAGYHVGGQRYQNQLAAYRKQGKTALVSIRKLLLRNLLSAMMVLVIGLSFLFLEIFFGYLKEFGIDHALVLTTIYTLFFLVGPVYLLAQTVPLISNYFAHHTLSRMTGRMLFFSTLGSFLGSVLSTLVLMNTVGVHLTATIAIFLLFFAVIILTRSWKQMDNIIALSFAAFMLFMNQPDLMRHVGYVADNAYNTAMVKKSEIDDGGELLLNHSRSSRFSRTGSHRYPYVAYIEDTILGPLSTNVANPKKILVLGAGGFTIGWHDRTNDYIFVDIDKQLKDISEEHLLPEPLHPNKIFVPESARAFLRNDTTKYDVIIVDVFSNRDSIPLEVTAVEFWQSVQDHLAEGGVMAANIIMSPRFEDRFSARIANTITAVFPQHIRQLVAPYMVWQEDKPSTDPEATQNVLFIHRDNPHREDRSIYTDDNSPYSIDRYIKD